MPTNFPYPYGLSDQFNGYAPFPENDAYGVPYASLPQLQGINYNQPYNGPYANPGWYGQTYVAPGGAQAGSAIMGNYTGATADQLARYGTSPDMGLLNMIRATGQSTLANKYFQTPGYQLLFGSDWAQMDPSLSPTERFQHSPGYQYAVDESLKQLQRSGAAKGLLESGSMQNALMANAQQMASQDYNNWWNQLNNNYENYQNRLAQLASAGMGATGGQQAFELGNQNAAGSQGMGNSLGTLFGNQGVFGASGMMNTAAAQGQNIMNAASINAQIASANAAGR